jgi:hypothetical protein
MSIFHAAVAGSELQDEDGEYTFDPEFAERVFGEDGKIYGYQDLKVGSHDPSFISTGNERKM